MKACWFLLVYMCLAVLSPAYAQVNQASVPIEMVGDFSSMQFTDEHQYGYEIELWRQGNKFFGLFNASAGLTGDTPTGLLEKISFEPSSGKLSFTAKLTTGMTFPNGKETPSHDLFEFSGTLKAPSISGELKQRNMLFPASEPQIERIELRQQPIDSNAQPKTYAEWQQQTDKILKFRGPRW